MASSLFDIDTDPALRLLLSCAEAIEDGDLKSADAYLQNILILADERPYLYKSRVVKYFADALVRRAYGLHPASSYFTFPVDPSPYYHCGSYLINGVIENVIHDALMEKNALMGNKRLHLIDFSIPYSSFQNSVLRTLPTFSGDPLPVRVSYILPPFLKKYVKFLRQMEFLTRDAKEVNVKLEDELKVVYGNSLAEVDECEIDFKRRRDDEMVVVYYKFKLDKLVKDAKAMERELVRLKEINPTIVIMLDFYSNHTHSNFLTCFKDSFQYSLKTLDCWAELDLYFDEEYEWECHIEAWEGNNVIRRHPSLTEWQHLFSMAGFSRIALNHRKGIDLIVKDVNPLNDFFSMWNQSWLEIMGKEEECLILGYKECPMFFLSAWKPKVEEEHLNFNSSKDKFGQGFNPYPTPLRPLQPFPEGLTLSRVAVLAEIHDILNHLYCEHKFSSALIWASKVDNMNETKSDPNKKFTFSIQSNSCYSKDLNSYKFMRSCEYKIEQTIIEKALESKDGYHFEPSLTKSDIDDYMYLQRAKNCDVDVVVAICLQNRYTSNDVYVVEFYWPATESEISKSFTPRIFNDLKHMEKKFVTVKVQGTEKAISNIPTSSYTARPLKIAEETEDVDAVEINGVNVQRGVVPNFPSPITIQSSSKVVAAPSNTLEEPHNQIFPNGDPEIVRANKEEPSKATQRELRSKVWGHFDSFEEDEKQVAKCKHCPKVLTGSSKSGTTHLNNHSKVCPGKKKQNQESQLILPVDTNEGSLRFDKKRSHMDLAKMMIKLQCPLDMAEQETFKNFVKGLQPMFEFQSKDILSYIHRIYDEEKEKLQLYFDKLASKFNLTGSVSSDHWFISFTLLEDGFREMDGILFKLRKSIEYVTETRHGKLKFQEAVDQVKLQGGKLWDDLSFRLESDFDILDSALRSREIFCKLEQIDDNFKLNPTMEEWENAVALQSCLKCFDDIKGTQCLPVSLYLPKLCDTYKKFLQLEKSSHSFVKLMKRKFDRYWSLCNLALAVASVLDPRLKFKIVELSYRVIYGHDSKMRLNMFQKVLRDVYYEYASEAKNLTSSASVLDDFNCSTIGLGNDSILDSLSKFASASNFNEEASWKLELELYLDEPLLPMDGAFFDILGWWCDKSQRFPILAKMAQDFLAIPVSISTSCSNISAMINNPAYSTLNPESMEALVCSENWLETPKEKPDHEKNVDDVIEILNYDLLFDNNQSDEVQSSSSESEDETTLKEEGPWCEQDIKAYLLARSING
ncbi:hypothetical protein GOBAR_AA38475 [Gossypium barbadense]|uniref:BED-type domain-containing protein n=1 Tax=Gossypium barbadense TaxID=3634 RepID=A0A2P5VTS7_GOSBA|nr:hypothetical protein GOBAR_AA38475 [Gossypium barbadense]